MCYQPTDVASSTLNFEFLVVNSDNYDVENDRNENTLFVRDGSRVTPVKHINTAVWARKQFLNNKNLYIFKSLELKYGNSGARVHEIFETACLIRALQGNRWSMNRLSTYI
jgi:hypothetical protein